MSNSPGYSTTNGVHINGDLQPTPPEGSETKSPNAHGNLQAVVSRGMDVSGSHTFNNDQPIDIAIVGGGIVGVILALGLLKRNINTVMYEQSRGYRELGAGVAFTSNAIKAMNILDPRIVDALQRVATPNGDPNNPTDYLRFVDGYTRENDDPDDNTEKVLFTLYTGYRGFAGAHRGHLMKELVKLIPEDRVRFGKRLLSYEERGKDSKVLLKFADDTTAEADAGKYLSTLPIPSNYI